MPTPGSPRSKRISVGKEIPSRFAQARCDSWRRKRAIARFSPRRANACLTAGGSDSNALGLFGITKSLCFKRIWSSLCDVRRTIANSSHSTNPSREGLDVVATDATGRASSATLLAGAYPAVVLSRVRPIFASVRRSHPTQRSVAARMLKKRRLPQRLRSAWREVAGSVHRWVQPRRGKEQNPCQRVTARGNRAAARHRPGAVAAWLGESRQPFAAVTTPSLIFTPAVAAPGSVRWARRAPC